MINRVTENMKFNTLTGSLFNVQGRAAELMEKISTRKNINRPSDNPIGAGQVLNYTSAQASIKQYQSNVTNAQNWLSLMDTNLEGIKKIIAEAKSIAAGASNDTMDSNATIVSSLIDNVLSLMNAKSGDSYIFGGSRTDVAPFSAVPVGSIEDAAIAPLNNFDGTATSSGDYTGTVDKTYLVKIVAGGDFDSATYHISTDGGKTWGATSSQGDLSAGTINFDGITLTFTPNTKDFAAGDSYTVNATAAAIGHVTETSGTYVADGGTVTSSGTYTGLINQTYLIEITTEDTVASGHVEYQYSTDGGGTWTAGKTVAADGTSILADGINLKFADNGATVHAGDRFTVNGYTDVIGAATEVPANSFAGTVTSGGIYTGSVDKTYAVKIVDGGTKLDLSDATYQISDDGGVTWGTTKTDLSAQITLGDGIKMTITPDAGGHTLTAYNLFTVHAVATNIGTASASTANTFNGIVTSGGTYTGTENKTYAVKIIDQGNPATQTPATYKISTDGGKTWDATQSLAEKTLQGGIANLTGGSAIGAATAWNMIDGITGIANNDTITIAGITHDGTAVSEIYKIKDITGPVQGLLDKIKDIFGNTATASIDSAGKIILTDNTVGDSQMALTLTANISGGGTLDFGTVAATTPTIADPSTINVGDGVTMALTAGTKALAANDFFTVNAYAAGYYQGNDDDLTMQVNKNNNYAYNITGSDAFTAANGPVASASIIGTGAGLTADSTVSLTRGESAGSWNLTSNAEYPDMKIISQSATEVTIATNGGSTADIKLDLSGNWYSGDTASFSVTATKGTPPTVPMLSTVTVSGPGSVDLLKTLNTLKTALESGDLTAVTAQADNLSVAETQVLQAQTKAGAKAGSLTNTGARLTSLNEQITSLKSAIEDVDLSKLIVSYQMEQTAMEASYNMAAKIGKMSILDYL